MSLQSCPTLCDPIDGSHQAPLSLGFSRQEHWSGLPFPSPMHESEKWKWSYSVVSDSNDPMDYSLPGSSVHGIFEVKVVEWGAIAFSEVNTNCTKKDLSDPDKHNGVITHLEPDILECEVKWALGSTTMNKASRGVRIPVELFQILKDDVVKVLHSICKQIWKSQQWPQDWKRSVFIPIPRKGSAKCSNIWQQNVQTTAQSHSSHMLAK